MARERGKSANDDVIGDDVVTGDGDDKLIGGAVASGLASERAGALAPGLLAQAETGAPEDGGEQSQVPAAEGETAEPPGDDGAAGGEARAEPAETTGEAERQAGDPGEASDASEGRSAPAGEVDLLPVAGEFIEVTGNVQFASITVDDGGFFDVSARLSDLGAAPPPTGGGDGGDGGVRTMGEIAARERFNPDGEPPAPPPALPDKAAFFAASAVFGSFGGELASLYSAFIATPDGQSGAPYTDLLTARPWLPVAGDLVQIEATASADGAALLADLVALGLQHGSSFGNVVYGFFPVDSIDEAAELGSLNFAIPSYWMSNVGATTSQADIAMNAEAARVTFGVDGTGVSIGVLSDSFNNLGGAAADFTSGDLPAAGVNVLADFGGGGSDEGRAMLQLVHDVAPGATLLFHTAVTGQAGFAQGILDLASAGADVIVDDIFFFAEPFFQDGVIAQAVDQVVSQGVAYFSSAGNSGRDSYESAFNASGVTGPFGEQMHDFNPGAGVDTLQAITIDPLTTLRISFQWDQPFASSLVPGSPGSASDLDIFLFDSTGSTILEQSVDDNINGNPVEILQFRNNTSSTLDVNVAIGSFSGALPGLMKYAILRGGDIVEFDTNSSTTFGHSNAAGTESVGAAFYARTPAFGTDPPLLESFSSAGVTPILFDTAGNRLATPEIRDNVDIVAPDGTNTTFFGSDADFDGFPNFFGTSAAAPHAAAVAGLMLEFAPGSSPAAINASLESTAIDMDDPFTSGFDTGFDRATGFGLIQADLAIADIQTGPTTGDDILTGTAGNDTIDALAGNDTVFGLAGNDTLIGGPGADRMEGGAGNDSFTVDDAGDLVIEQTAAGIDRVLSSIDFTLPGNVENLTLLGVLNIAGTGNLLPNVIIGNGGDNNLVGGAGNDRLTGLGGDDTLIGNSGSDRLFGGAGSDVLSGGGGGDLISGQGGNDTLLGQAGNDRLFGNTGDDRLFGGTGADTLNGGAGADRMEGGAGNDSYTVDNAGDTVIEQAAAGTDIVLSSITFTLPGEIENLTLTGGNDIAGTGNGLANIITGNAGANTLNGEAGNDRLIGRSGDDNLFGGADDDLLAGGAGNDRLFGENGTDTLLGQGGNDRLNGGAGNDRLLGGAGNDNLNGGTGADRMEGGTGNDTYIVDNAGDTVIELAGAGTADRVLSSVDFVLTNNIEKLSLFGNADIDGTGNGLANRIFGNSGVNVLNGGSGNDFLAGQGGNDKLIGSTGNDRLFGGGGNDVLAGGPGNDLLSGQFGDDILLGQAGNDRLFGNAGDDTIIFDAADSLRVDGGSGSDTLKFTGAGDALNLLLINDSLYTAFEEVDLTGTGDNALTLSETDVLAMTDGINALAADAGIADAGNTLIITGNAGDSVASGGAGGFTDSGTDVTIAGQSYSVFDGNTTDATLLVDNDISTPAL